MNTTNTTDTMNAMNVSRVWKWGRLWGRTHLPELPHELRVPKDLQPHHLRVLLDRPATPQNTLHRTQFTPHERSRENADAPARAWDVDLSPE